MRSNRLLAHREALAEEVAGRLVVELNRPVEVLAEEEVALEAREA
jgi:hypothetical protein